MDFGEIEIAQLVESVWTSVLGWEVQPSAEPPGEMGGEHFLTGCVPITGDWTGNVLLHCHRDLASEAASTIFALSTDEVSLELLQDALGELTNIVGGNLKALFGGMCFLGLPTVANGTDYALRVMGSRSVLRVPFESRGLPFLVEVCERQPALVAS